MSGTNKANTSEYAEIVKDTRTDEVLGILPNDILEIEKVNNLQVLNKLDAILVELQKLNVYMSEIVGCDLEE